MIRSRLAPVLCMGLLAAAAAQAQTVVPPVSTGTQGGAGLASHKQRILGKIQERMATLQSLQSCVSSAQTADALRACEEQARAARGAHEKKC